MKLHEVRSLSSGRHLTLPIKELTSKGDRYRRILAAAKDSDEHVRQQWDGWETNIRELTWDEASSFSLLLNCLLSCRLGRS